MNTSHESYLAPFFKEMNIAFSDKWCVLHSYETLPYYSLSDVDMAFSGTHIIALERLIKKVANTTGWVLLQKLWYDVQNCYYYVLRNRETDTLLAIDFLIDNDAIGKYGFTTKTLTSDCILIDKCFPIPNPETAICYKLVKRIVKKRTIEEDEFYLKEQLKAANKENLNIILTNQFGETGKEPILKYLTDDREGLLLKDIILLNKIRQKKISSIGNHLKFWFWEAKRTFNRMIFPRGMIITISNLDNEELGIISTILEKKVDILFRFVKVNKSNSKLINLKSFIGSTLVVCPTKKNNKDSIKASWSRTTIINIDKGKVKTCKLEEIAQLYYQQIVQVLEIKMAND